MLLSGLLGFILLQLKQASQRVAWHQTLDIAEAGINYYYWCLNHGIQDDCLLEKDYFDTTGKSVGKFYLEISAEMSCGQTTKRIITSTGETDKFPKIQRKVQALYARPSLAKYAYLLNDNVWLGADHEIRGFYHSNGGIRLDGENQSLVTSARETWVCTDSFGCSPCPLAAGCVLQESECVCPGVFTTTANSNPDLFDWPTPPFDFEGITVDLAEMKEISQTDPEALYLPPSTDINPEAEGYHLILKNNGTFDVWIITELSASWAYSEEEDWHDDYFIINQESFYNTYSVTPACSLVFVEDNLWLEGELKGELTVASANLISPSQDTAVVLPGNINYTTLDGSDGLALIAEKNVLISPNSPNNMELRGIFVAQKGRFGRNHYPGNIKESLEINGSIVSNDRVGTQWLSGGSVISGYLARESYFDTNLVYDPPHFVPYLTPEYALVDWEEVE